MAWLFFAISAYALYSVTNFIYKFLIEKRIKDPIAIVILGGFEYLILGGVIFLAAGARFIPLNQSLLLLLAGCLLTFYLIPYFKALKLEDTSRVVPLFQFYPIITLILSFVFLHEILTFKALLGFALVIVGGFILGTEKISGKIFSIRESLFLMLLASFLYSLTNIIFKFVTIENFWINFSYLTFGSALGCFLLLIKTDYRKTFSTQLHQLSLNTLISIVVNSIINLFAELFTFFAISIGSVSLVSAINGIQPFIVLVYGLLLTLFFPKIIKEDIKKETLATKIIAAVVLFAGIYLISF